MPLVAKRSSVTKQQIFLVEDDECLRDTMADVLIANGYDVATAHDGRDALLKLNATATAPDAILSDFEMPEMSGDVLIGHLRRNAKFAQVPIAVISAIPRTAPGANCVLRKPLFPDALVRAVKILCAGALAPTSSSTPRRP